MLILDQVSMRTDDMEAQIQELIKLGHYHWVRDTVEVAHLYTHPNLREQLGETFRVHLAFNYDLMPGQEFELVQLTDGMSAPFLSPGFRMSHFGYHTKTDQKESGADSLLKELLFLQHELGLSILQVSQTISHVNTQRRYRYAFVSGAKTGGIPLRVIQRLLPFKAGDLDAVVHRGRTLFAELGE